MQTLPDILGVIAITGVIIGCIYLIVYFFAQASIFFTAPHQNTAVARVSGNSNPRFIAPMKDAYLNDPSKPGYREDVRQWERIEDPNNYYAPLHRNRLGIYWVGIYPFVKVYWYDFRWTEWSQPQQHKVNVPVPRDESTNFIFMMQFTYYSKVTDVKTNNPDNVGQELISVDIEYVITVSCNNPYVALFMNDDWLAQLFSITNNAVRNYGGRRSYADLASEQDREARAKDKNIVETLHRQQAGMFMVKEDDSLNHVLLALNEQIPGGRKPDYTDPERPKFFGTQEILGITIHSAEIISVGFGADVSKELRDATVEKYIAEQKAIGAITAAQAAKEVRKNATDAEVYNIDQVSEAFKRGGAVAMQNKMMETIEKAGQKGNTVIFANDLNSFTKSMLLTGAIDVPSSVSSQPQKETNQPQETVEK